MGVKDGGKVPQQDNSNGYKGLIYYMMTIMIITILLNGLIFPSVVKQKVVEVG